jgi:hypothetical protein
MVFKIYHLPFLFTNLLIKQGSVLIYHQATAPFLNIEGFTFQNKAKPKEGNFQKTFAA